MKRTTGRKCKYAVYVKPKFKEIKSWIKKGISEKDIANNLGISYSTFSDYKNKYPEFSELLKESRVKPVTEIKQAMFKRAIGFSFKEKRIVIQQVEIPDELQQILESKEIDMSKFTKPQLIKTEIIEKRALPDVAAGLILLQHWDKEHEWSRDPAILKLKKKELEIKKKQSENSTW